MKRFLIPIIALAFALISCNEDKETMEPMFSGFATAYTNSQGHISTVRDDMGNEYTIVDNNDRLAPDSVFRYVLSMELGQDNKARILQKVTPLFGAIKAPESSVLNDSLKKQDPVQVNAAYIGGGYLNITLGIKVQDQSKRHNLLYARKSDESKLTFTIYHDNDGDEPMFTMFAYLSIPLKYYGLNRNDTVFLKCKGYQEDCNMKLIYR